MRLAVSNIALPSFDVAAQEHACSALAALGVTGLEVAPSKVWRDTSAVTASDVDTLRRRVESAGLAVVGIHSLFFDRPDLGLFRGNGDRAATLDFLVSLSAMCRDLGGHTMVFGSGGARKRGELTEEEADTRTVDFLHALARRIEGHGTILVIEPLSTHYADYVHTLRHADRIVSAVGRPEIGLHLDLAAAAQADELDEASLSPFKGRFEHVHVNEPDLGVLRSGGAVDHALAGSILRSMEYRGYCSLEQKMVTEQDYMAPIFESLDILKECYS